MLLADRQRMMAGASCVVVDTVRVDDWVLKVSGYQIPLHDTVQKFEITS